MVRAASAMLDVKHLRKIYANSSRTVEAIRDVSFTVGQGELVCIVGPSGAGKTTLLKCVAGLLAPSSAKSSSKVRQWSSRRPPWRSCFRNMAAACFRG